MEFDAGVRVGLHLGLGDQRLKRVDLMDHPRQRRPLAVIIWRGNRRPKKNHAKPPTPHRIGSWSTRSVRVRRMGDEFKEKPFVCVRRFYAWRRGRFPQRKTE
jgi:hypothetical protein